MPKRTEKQASRLGYDVVRVHSGDPDRMNLSRQEKSDILKAVAPHTPSGEFLDSYKRALTNFVWDVNDVQEVTPDKVLKRLGSIHQKAQELFNKLNALEISDQSLLDRPFTIRFLQNRQCISLNEFISYLELFIENTTEAVHLLGGNQKKGRMPAFSEECLAISIGLAIQNETGKRPALTRSGLFDRVLKCALSAGDARLQRRIGKGRRDVMDLMRHARKVIDSK